MTSYSYYSLLFIKLRSGSTFTYEDIYYMNHNHRFMFYILNKLGVI